MPSSELVPASTVQIAVLEERVSQIRVSFLEQMKLLQDQTTLVLQMGSQQNMMVLDLISRIVQKPGSGLVDVLVSAAPAIQSLVSEFLKTHPPASPPMEAPTSGLGFENEGENSPPATCENLSRFVDGYCLAKGRPDLGDEMYHFLSDASEDAWELSADEAYRKALHASQEPDPKDTEDPESAA